MKIIDLLLLLIGALTVSALYTLLRDATDCDADYQNPKLVFCGRANPKIEIAPGKGNLERMP